MVWGYSLYYFYSFTSIKVIKFIIEFFTQSTLGPHKSMDSTKYLRNIFLYQLFNREKREVSSSLMSMEFHAPKTNVILRNKTYILIAPVNTYAVIIKHLTNIWKGYTLLANFIYFKLYGWFNFEKHSIIWAYNQY